MTLQSHGLERCLETARVNDKVVNKAARRPITSLSGAIFWFQHDPLWSCIRMDDHIVGIGPRTNSFCPPQTTWFKWQSCSNVRTFNFESRAFRPCGLHSVSFLLVPLSCYRLVMQHQDLLQVSTVFLSKPICSIHRTQQTQTQVLCSLIVLISVCPLLLRTAVQRIQVVWQQRPELFAAVICVADDPCAVITA